MLSMVSYLCSTDATMKPWEASSTHIAEYKVLEQNRQMFSQQQLQPNWEKKKPTHGVYLKAPRPWEKMTTGHFSLDLNGASM